MPFISAFLYNGARNSSSLSSSDDAVEDNNELLTEMESGSSTLTFRYYTGIHECCQCEIGYNEECYDGLICSDPHIRCAVNIPLAAGKKKMVAHYIGILFAGIFLWKLNGVVILKREIIFIRRYFSGRLFRSYFHCRVRKVEGKSVD